MKSHIGLLNIGIHKFALNNEATSKEIPYKLLQILGSAASLDKLDVLPTIPNSSVKRSDSDIEILSNPSQSSIEVIEGPGR